MVHLNFEMFTVAKFVFSSARFLNMCKPRKTFHLLCGTNPRGLAFYGKEPAYLLAYWACCCGWWMQAGSVPCGQKFSCKLNLSFFMAVPPNRLTFYLFSPVHILSSLFSPFCLFPNDIFYTVLKLGFWDFNYIFLRMQFSLVSTFFL